MDKPLTPAECAAYNAAMAQRPDVPCVRCGCFVLQPTSGPAWCAGCRQTDAYLAALSAGAPSHDPLSAATHAAMISCLVTPWEGDR